MHGKTKSFFEDTSIIIVVLVSIYGLYYLYSNYYIEKNIEQPIVIIKNVKAEIKTVIKIEPEIIIKEPITKDINKTIIIEEKVVVKKEIIEEKPKIIVVKKEEIISLKETIIKKEKNVDLKLLRAFLIETQYKIRKNIIYPTYTNDINDTNQTKQNTFMKLKVTILKNGNYEQLKFVEGNREIFDLNKMNILKVFPLIIDEKISDYFPRYFRMKIE